MSIRTVGFLSRHEPTPTQHALAAQANLKLVRLGDVDAFSITHAQLKDLRDIHDLYAFAVVNAALALKCAGVSNVVVFENSMRADMDGTPTFVASELHMYAVRAMDEGVHYIDEVCNVA